MDKKRSIHFNFVLFLAIIFVFFALVLRAIETRVTLFNGNNTQEAINPKAEDVQLAGKFGYVSDKPQIGSDPVLGSTSKWVDGSKSLVINDYQALYKNEAAAKEKVSDTKELQEKAQTFLDEKKLSENVVISYEKNKLLKVDEVHFEEVKNVKDADVLEVMFTDVATGDDRVRVRVTGAGEILEVLVIRN